MIIKSLTAATFAVALAAVPAQEARADAGDVVGGLIIGGLIGAAIANGNNGGGNRGTTSGGGGGGIPATQMGRDTQTALNYFGFQAGAVDGQIGNGTRQAIERYQLVMGYPVNGREYATYQYDQLMQAYYWAINGGSAQTGLVGQPLLIAYRDAQVAPQQPQVVVVPAPAPAQPAPQVVAQPPAQTVIVPAPQPASSNK
ncbi:peptidoglycan-binding domain-containing protein [Nioella sp.]|uniref:peptidoglycan-binding domain-containing protein n=1 Tax=Nioella sp. TaxID=1912091 RepID=UPI003B516B91